MLEKMWDFLFEESNGFAMYHIDPWVYGFCLSADNNCFFGGLQFYWHDLFGIICCVKIRHLTQKSNESHLHMLYIITSKVILDGCLATTDLGAPSLTLNGPRPPNPWTHPAHSPHKDATNLGVKINNFDMTKGHGKKKCSLHSIILVG